ncbi:UNVERIFIED_CONTAM: Histone-lysine N-methyltransferase ATXR2 [Sesamum radiatum]|uniref:Histone-lysine N-methyltransferase ATXR2 n=1 Tax=Sesamum radiatum TaxID=300843 RepID=A0AAW2KKE0_SESRA
MGTCICPIDAQFSDQVAALLTPPTLPQVQAGNKLLQEYFEALVAERQCSGFKVKPDGQHGKGVYSEVDFQEDDLVLKDEMLVGAQHSSNKIDCLVCSFCFRFIGSIELQIGRKLYLQELGVSAVDECGSSDGIGCSTSSEKTRIPQDAIQSLMNSSLRLPYSENFPLPSVVPCLGGCKEAYYCRSAAYSNIQYINRKSSFLCLHHVLCFLRGKDLCYLKIDIVGVTILEVISFTILRYRKLKAAHVQREGKHDSSNQFDGCIFPLLLEAWKPVSMGFKRRWWECIALPEDVDSSEEVEFRMQIKDLAFESLQLLKEAIYEKECAPLFSLDIYGHIIGMFELNNLDLVVASPVEDYFLYIDDLPLSQKKEAEKLTKPFLDALGDDYSISCQGTAFFPLQSCMNHSCIPNAKAFKREEDKDGQATIVALRPIFKGEEIIYLTYIDEDLPYDERQELLADYGFRCKCPRCVEEEP